MARFSIISKDGSSIRYEGKPRYIGTYLKPSYLEFSEIASPTPIDWQVGDYVDYPRTGMRYRLYSIPQASKNARKGSHGRAFTYSNVQLHTATKELEIALFKDLVSADNNIHFSTSPDVATFENVYGIARRIQACMDDLYPNRWVIEVADFNLEEDEEILENITTAKDFVLSGGTCLDALTKIYELWQELGWIHTYDSASGRDVITIGYANKRIGANTTDAYIYGKGNGLTAIKKTQANKDEFATRLYVYGSDRNLPSRYYNGKEILNAESVDIRNLMIPIYQWGTTGGVPDARKAYLENAEAVAKYGVVPKTHYFDSDDAGADIYPTIEGITIGQVRRLQADYIPDASIYPNDGERIDEIKSAVNPNDDGVIRPLGKAYKYYKIENIASESEEITLGESTTFRDTKILLMTDLESEGKVDVTVIPNIQFGLEDAGFTEVNATFELTDDPTKMKRLSETSTIAAKKNETTGAWEFNAPRISVDYDFGSDGSIPVCYVMTIDATLEQAKKDEVITLNINEGEIEIGANAILDKEFTITLKQIGFNIEERASVGSGKTISMKTGDNEGRNFVIKECRYEASSDSWILTCKRQQDNSLGMLFPNNDYQLKSGDRFVLIDIAMPELYLSAAMERLFAEGQKLLSKASRIQNNYEPSIDAKVMIESGRTIREGMFMQIADEDIIDGTTEYILIDTINIYEDEAAIPTYKVTLKEKKKVNYKGTPSATTSSDTNPVEEKVNVSVNLSGYVTQEQFKSIEDLKDMFYMYDENTIGTKHNFFSEQEISANGLGIGGGTSGGGLIQNVLGVSSLGTVASEDNTTTFSAYAIDSIYKRLVELEENGGGGGNVDVDLSDYYTKTEVDGLFTKDNIKSVLQISDWALKSSLAASDVPNLPWSKITSGKPTTLAGYGITDAMAKSDYFDIHNGNAYIGDGACNIYVRGELQSWPSAWSITKAGAASFKSLSVNNSSVLTASDLDDYGFLTGITKSMVTNALGYTPFNSASFTKANIQSKLGISDWALASSKPSYSYSEINGAPDSLSDLTDDILNGYYLKLAGGTITGNLTVNGYTKIGSATLAWKSSALEVNKPFYSTGEISANGLYTSSDMRFKYKIEDISLDLDTIANAPMFRFIWNNNDDESIHIGSSAQYWKEHARELVSIDDKDFHRLDYSTLGVLMGKSLATEVKELKKAVEEINRRMEYGN